MKKYRYLIIGAGMTGDAAVRGIRELDGDGAIGLIGIEKDPPYDRPPLTKGLWKGKPLEKIWRDTASLGADLTLGTRIVKLNAGDLSVVDKNGEIYTGEKLLLATGGKPRRFPFGDDQIIYYRTLHDYHSLRKLCEQGDNFVVIGGGFIGSEISAALAMNGKRVTFLLSGAAIGGHVYPSDLAQFLSDYYTEKGVNVIPNARVVDVAAMGSRTKVTLKDGRTYDADGVVAGLGIQPNTELAEQAKINVSDGIVVDERLLTNNKNIYAAGDVAEFFNPALGKRIRIEHEDNANSMGRQAGRNMAGANELYHHLPFFYSDLFELGYEAVGELDSRYTIVADWKTPLQKGVIYYLGGSRVRGVLLWNVWEKVPDARKLIAEPGPIHPDSLIGRIS